jgi:uncharacterized cupin superfamily protein
MVLRRVGSGRMSIPEARIEETPAGRVACGRGWFVLSLVGARGFATEGHGVFCPFESPDARFEDVGINVHVLQPGERSALYHAESAQEGFLVLAGECIAIVEGQERHMRQWDYLHCPPGTYHITVGAGDGPCVILMVGTRSPDITTHYPVNELAARYGASPPHDTHTSKEAYADLTRTVTRERAPWPPRD